MENNIVTYIAFIPWNSDNWCNNDALNTAGLDVVEQQCSDVENSQSLPSGHLNDGGFPSSFKAVVTARVTDSCGDVETAIEAMSETVQDNLGAQFLCFADTSESGGGGSGTTTEYVYLEASTTNMVVVWPQADWMMLTFFGWAVLVGVLGFFKR